MNEGGGVWIPPDGGEWVDLPTLAKKYFQKFFSKIGAKKNRPKSPFEGRPFPIQTNDEKMKIFVFVSADFSKSV